MSYQTMLKYVAPFLVSTSLACATNNTKVETPTLENKIEKVETELERMEREVANDFLGMAKNLHEKNLVECTETEANKRYVCSPTITVKAILNKKTPLILQKIAYNSNSDKEIDSVDIYLVPPGIPKYFGKPTLKVIKDFELMFRIDLENERLLYIKTTEKVEDIRLPQEEEKSINIRCYNALRKELPINAQGECVYK